MRGADPMSAWSFETDAAYQQDLDWADAFVTKEVEPLDLVLEHGYDMADPVRQALIPPLQAQVRERGLWACHLGPQLGGPGYGQVKLALLNEILGRSAWGPIVFGCHAPDSGNAEILAHFGSDYLKQTYLRPLLDNEIVSCFSMTEPAGGSDPTQFTTSAVLDGDGWVLDGQKWFSSHARFASFLIVMAVTDPEAAPHRRLSAFVVPTETPGVEIVRNVGVVGHGDPGTHAYVRYTGARIAEANLLGERGDGFVVAQTRLGGGRIHHAMRTVGLARKALDMMCERAVSRGPQGSKLSDKQFVQGYIADSYAQLLQFRLMVLYTAWEIDKYNDYKKVRKDIATVKVTMPTVLHDIA